MIDAGKLEGAGEFPAEFEQIGTAARFAAVWNAATPELRDAWWQDVKSALELRHDMFMKQLELVPHEIASPPRDLANAWDGWARAGGEVIRAFVEAMRPVWELLAVLHEANKPYDLDAEFEPLRKIADHARHRFDIASLELNRSGREDRMTIEHGRLVQHLRYLGVSLSPAMLAAAHSEGGLLGLRKILDHHEARP